MGWYLAQGRLRNLVDQNFGRPDYVIGALHVIDALRFPYSCSSITPYSYHAMAFTLLQLTERGGKSVKDVIKDQLEKLHDPEKRLSGALHYLSTAVVLEEQVGEIAAESWSYIQVNELWTAGGHASLDAFKECIYFDDILKATVDRSIGTIIPVMPYLRNLYPLTLATIC